MSPRTTGLAALVLAALLSMFVVAAATQAAPDKKAGKPAKTVKSASDGAKSKLHPKLQKQVESGSTDSIHVFVTVAGDPAPAAALLDDAQDRVLGGTQRSSWARSACRRCRSSPAPRASWPSARSSSSRPAGRSAIPTRRSARPPTRRRRTRRCASSTTRKCRTPRRRRRRARTSRRSRARRARRQDAQLRRRLERRATPARASTVGVLDGGTDFGHPDLIGTWQTWSGADTARRAGWNGWPKAFDPYGTLQCWLAPELSRPGPVLVHADDGGDLRRRATSRQGTCPVEFATQDRPVAQLQRAGRRRTSTRTRSRAAWTKSGNGPARQPSGRLPARALRRAAGVPRHRLRTRPASTTRSTSTSTTTTTSPTRSRSPRRRPRPTAT